LTRDLDSSIEGKAVILVEDILDTGMTLQYLLKLFQQRKPKHLRVAVLLDKPDRRIAPVRADYVGFSIPTNSSSVTGWTTPNATGTCHTLAFSHSEAASRKKLRRNDGS